MAKTPSDMTLRDLIRELWPILDASEREIITLAEQKLGQLDTWIDEPSGRSETNYHGEAYDALKALSAKLRQSRPNNALVEELHARYGAGKTTSW